MRHESKIAPSRGKRTDTRRWLTGLVVIVATIVSFIGFARVSVGWTLAISTIVLIALVIFLWSAGGTKQRPG